LLPISYVCSTCGHWISPLKEDPERCPKEDGAHHHSLSRELDPKPLHFPDLGPAHPFLRYRELLTVYHRARFRGMTDRRFVEAVLEVGDAPLEETPEKWPSLSVQSGFQAEPGAAAGIWVLASGCQDGEDRRTRFARSLRERLPVSETASDTTLLSVWTRESLRLRAYQFVSWTRCNDLSFDRVLLCSQDQLLGVAWGEGLRDAARLGALSHPPRLHVVVRDGETLSAGYEETMDRILGAMHEGVDRTSIPEVARRDPRVRRQIGDSVQKGLRESVDDNAVRLAAERALATVAARGVSGENSYLILRSFVETGGFPVTIYDRTVRAAAESVDESQRDVPDLVDLVAAALLLRTLGDIDPSERICLVLP